MTALWLTSLNVSLQAFESKIGGHRHMFDTSSGWLPTNRMGRFDSKRVDNADVLNIVAALPEFDDRLLIRSNKLSSFFILQTFFNVGEEKRVSGPFTMDT